MIEGINWYYFISHKVLKNIIFPQMNSIIKTRLNLRSLVPFPFLFMLRIIRHRKKTAEIISVFSNNPQLFVLSSLNVSEDKHKRFS